MTQFEKMETVPKIVARCSLDMQYEAWILDNASVSINDPEGTAFLLNAERAYNLLDFLYRYRDLLHSAVHMSGELPAWARPQRTDLDAADLPKKMREDWSNDE